MVVIYFILLVSFFTIITSLFYLVGWGALAQMSFWFGLACVVVSVVYLVFGDRN